ncbi:hypothetical protein CMO90_01230 [Candidatus Woesearchaeota archaeon]|jgi:single-stranded DNA-specific DHH superfamily exonuclease|nr:hypothetical protein [Candidatus Woesearchaeota archaeon]|tara:strand:+ start:1037 stop:2065 length:1029 start_codon:yes stop_codon:yes gene_type:complete
MAINQKEINEIRKALGKSARPLIFFDDDPDGACSFLQLYHYVGEGKGVILKIGSELGEVFARKVDEYQPDLVVILDVPNVSQDFIDLVKQKIIWIDHHPPIKRKKVNYYNPRIHNDKDNRPTSYWAWKITKKDLWIAMAGCVADWSIPDFKDDFMKKYSGLFKKNINNPAEALFNTKIGLLARMISFNLKGTVADSMKAVRILSKIEHPNEILKQTTPKGKFIYKKFNYYNKEYQDILKEASQTKSKILLHIYPYNKTSFTSELSNELLYKHPNKLILVGRDRNGEIKFSVRGKDIKVLPIVKKVLETLEGRGGGHEYACGLQIKSVDLDKLLKIINEELEN